MLANTARDATKKATPYEPEDFHPGHQAAPPPKVGIRALKAVFIDKRSPKA